MTCSSSTSSWVALAVVLANVLSNARRYVSTASMTGSAVAKAASVPAAGLEVVAPLATGVGTDMFGW
ncbi:hypothetical protein KCH_25970 [Kitasatospora cheerisanensis KCTC 2395]|uniref:Uncharacterized protein n=1 Tax=Kitasatospora cheerisanensis KCTC 2395 TaxID=1348663 RepID=A0A066YW04_9ACTN|nr:hypothetical protein KCH_25970 [Kitasatospora cheerisanensis KCTC 2395]